MNASMIIEQTVTSRRYVAGNFVQQTYAEGAPLPTVEQAERQARQRGIKVTRALSQQIRGEIKALHGNMRSRGELPQPIYNAISELHDKVGNRGSWLADLLWNGGWSLASLKGEAGKWRAKYAQRRDRLVERVGAALPAGWRAYLANDWTDHGRTVLVIEDGEGSRYLWS